MCGNTSSAEFVPTIKLLVSSFASTLCSIAKMHQLANALVLHLMLYTSIAIGSRTMHL